MPPGLLNRYYNEDEFPRFSLPELAKGRVFAKQCLVQENAIGNSLAGRLADAVTKRIEARMIRQSGDMINPMSSDDMTWAREETDMIEQRDRRRHAVSSIVDSFTDEEMESEYLRLFCIQISGWWKELREGIPFQRWNTKTGVWAPLYVRECLRLPNKKGSKKKYFKTTLVSIAGPTAGEEWDFTWSSGYVQNMLRNIGIPKYESHAPDDLGGMWVTSFMKPRGRGMLFDHLHVSSSQGTANKKLYKSRLRGCNGLFEPFKGKSCRTCPVGRNKCPVSRIQGSFNRFRDCAIDDGQGNKHKGFFRDSSSVYCFGCLITGKGKTDD